MKIKAYCIGFLVCIYTFVGQAQEIRQINNQRFEFFKINSQASVLYFDSFGFLWIGTSNGAIRFDGYKYKLSKENPMDSLGFKGTQVYAITEDHRGGIWVGTNLGLNYMSPESDAFKHIPLGSDPVYGIAEDHENRMWISRGAAIQSFSTKSPESTPAIISFQIEDVFIRNLFITSDKKILGIGKGCYELKQTKQRTISTRVLLEHENLMSIGQRKDGILVIASDSSLFFLDSNGVLIDKKDIKLNSSRVAVHFDQEGFLWLGLNWGFMKLEVNDSFEPQIIKSYDNWGALDIAEDHSGNLFFASRNYGFFKLGWNNNQYNYIALPKEFENAWTFNFLEDKIGNFWIATDNGLLFYDIEHASFTQIFPQEGSPESWRHQPIYSLMEDREENIWIGTSHGIVKYEKQSGQISKIKESGLSHHIIQDKTGLLWFVGNSILYSLDPSDYQIISYENIKGAPKKINQIFIDSDNVLWAWTDKVGLQKYSIQNGVPIPGETLLHSLKYGGEGINWMLEDGLGRLWLSKQIGVYIVDKESGELIKFFNSANSPLQQDDVFEMVKDHDGHIWLKQSSHGSISIDPVDFSVVSLNPAWLFNTKGQVYSCVVDVGRDGKLFTDGTGEFCIFYSDSSRMNRIPPSIVLEELKVNDTPTSESKITLPYFQNNINFEFSGIHFDNPGKNNYEFFLKGFDKDWVKSGHFRQALYSALPPGNYTFYVKASNSDGVWSEPVILSSILIKHPWWSSILAYIIYIFILTSIVITIYQMQLRRKIAIAEVKKLNEIDEFKNRFFSNISHEFRTPLTVISGLAESLDGKSGKLIRRNVSQILTLVNQILELSKIESNFIEVHNEEFDLIAFTRYISFSYSSLYEEKLIDIQVPTVNESLFVSLDREKYETILQNLLSNAIKFTPEHGRIFVEIKKVQNNFELTVSDTGNGISSDDLPLIFNRFYQGNNQLPGNKGTGIGLALTSQLVHLLNGRLEVTSSPGQGTTFRVILPTGVTEATVIPTGEKTVSNLETEADDDRDQVLLIEDNKDVCIVIRDLLQANYIVFTAENGIEGLQKTLDIIPDIIISDVKMPGRDGLELTQILKNDKRTSHIPIILLTAKADIVTRLKGLSYGADMYLQKPFNNKELLLNVQNLLKLREALRLKYSDEEFLERDSKNPEEKFISSLRDLVKQNISDDTFGIEAICREVGISRTQLHRKLKALTGKSISLYVRDIRLSEGRNLIRRKDGNVSEIAYSTGFKDPNYFSRLYTEKYGYPPTQEPSQGT